MDWNNDGKKDLITGERNGTIRIYLNTNTDADPVFNGYKFLQMGAGNFDCGYTSCPHVVDWNNDGKKDVLCGEDSGRLMLLINVGTDAAPVFTSSVYIKNGASNLDVGSRNSPTVADWNRDGRKDLIIGDTNGNLRYFENKGTDAAPVFNGYSLMTAGGKTIDVTYYSRPDVADWNNDGVLDILCGNYVTSPKATAFVVYFESMGPLALSTNRIYEGTGGAIDMALDAGASNGGRNYIILGSASGTSPGIPLPGGLATLPVNWDIFTNVVLDLLNTPMFQNFMGTLSNSGEAKAAFDTLGPVTGAAGIHLYFAFALNAPWDYVSNGAAIEIVP